MPPPIHRRGEPPEFRTPNLRKFFLFLLKCAIMAVTFSIFLSFLCFAAVLLLHFLLMSNAFRRRYTSSPAFVRPHTQARLVNLVYSAAAAFRRNRDCAICLDSFQEGDDCSSLPVCGHLFHAKCLNMWIRKTPNCPICRTGLDSDSGLPSSSISGDNTWKRL